MWAENKKNNEDQAKAAAESMKRIRADAMAALRAYNEEISKAAAAARRAAAIAAGEEARRQAAVTLPDSVSQPSTQVFFSQSVFFCPMMYSHYDEDEGRCACNKGYKALSTSRARLICIRES